MLEAQQLKTGTVVKVGEDLYSTARVDYHEGSGKFACMVFVKLKGLTTRHAKEMRVRPTDRFEDVVLERQELEYLYRDEAGFCFMDPDTFEQTIVAPYVIGEFERFLQPNRRIPVDFFEGRPVNVVFPETVELTVVTAPPGCTIANRPPTRR